MFGAFLLELTAQGKAPPFSKHASQGPGIASSSACFSPVREWGAGAQADHGVSLAWAPFPTVAASQLYGSRHLCFPEFSFLISNTDRIK